MFPDFQVLKVGALQYLGVTLRTHETQKAVKSARSRSVFRTQPVLRIRHCFVGSWGHRGRNFSREGV